MLAIDNSLFFFIANPAIQASVGTSMHAVPLTPPSALIESPGVTEMLQPRDRDIVNLELTRGRDALISFASHLDSLIQQMDCNGIESIEDKFKDVSLDHSTPRWQRSVQMLGAELTRSIGKPGYSAVCCDVMMRLGFLKCLISAEEEILDLIMQYFANDNTDIGEIVAFQKRMQSQALSVAVNGLIHQDFGNSELFSSVPVNNSSTSLHEYMGELSNLILKLTEQAVSPPITLSSNLENSHTVPDLSRVYHDHELMLKGFTGFSAGPSSLESMSLYDMASNYIFPARTCSRKLSNVMISSSIDSEIAFDFPSSSLLPLYVPDKLDIYIYLISLQSAYKPLGIFYLFIFIFRHLLILQ